MAFSCSRLRKRKKRSIICRTAWPWAARAWLYSLFRSELRYASKHTVACSLHLVSRSELHCFKRESKLNNAIELLSFCSSNLNMRHALMHCKQQRSEEVS